MNAGVLDIALNIALGALAISILLCGWRLIKGPEVTDRIIAIDTLYLNAVGLTVLLNIRLGTEMLFEAALIVAMLGFVGTVALSRYLTRGDVIE